MSDHAASLAPSRPHRWYGSGGLDRGPQVPMQQPRPSRARSTIPEPIARAAHAQYAKVHPQSFERLHERGGFSTGEIIMLLADALGIPVPDTPPCPTCRGAGRLGPATGSPQRDYGKQCPACADPE